MARKGYVLIETEVGTAKAVAAKLKELAHKHVRVTLRAHHIGISGDPTRRKVA